MELLPHSNGDALETSREVDEITRDIRENGALSAEHSALVFALSIVGFTESLSEKSGVDCSDALLDAKKEILDQLHGRVNSLEVSLALAAEVMNEVTKMIISSNNTP